MMMILFPLLTLGISQDNICLPREQVNAMFEDVLFYTLKADKLDSLNSVYESNISIKDSIIINLEEQILLQNSLIEELDLDKEDAWYVKYIYLLIGIGVTKI